MRSIIFMLVVTSAFGVMGLHSHSFAPMAGGLSDELLREMVQRMGNDLAADPNSDYLDLPQRILDTGLHEGVATRGMKEPRIPLDYEDMLSMSPSLRDPEYLSHSTLLGLGSMLYPGGEGKIRLKPSASGPKVESKTDGVLPAYCNPPNPCPIGYTGEDGCLEEFENTPSFSQHYQSLQDCMCDTEHMKACPESNQESEISTLARSIQNKGVLDDTLDTIMERLAPSDPRQLMVKKLYAKKSRNPYLQGERLPVAAKKGGQILM